MGATSIEWTDTTWNVFRGCSRVSRGCVNCYAERMAARFSGPGQPYEGLAMRSGRIGGKWTGEVRLVEDLVEEPYRWRKARRVFVNSMSDLFHEKVRSEDRFRIFDVMSGSGAQRGHVFQVLTKRPSLMRDWMLEVGEAQQRILRERRGMALAWPPRNVWLGVSVEDQATADERIPLLLETPAAVRFVSIEPLLDRVDLDYSLGGTRWIGGQRGCGGTHEGDGSPGCPREPHHHHDDRCKRGLDWVIVGGESGAGARPMDPRWARIIRDQCRAADVPLFMKQMGRVFAESCGVRSKGGAEVIPEDLRIREFPRGRVA